VVKSLTAFVGGGRGGAWVLGGVILIRKKANMACGSDLYINKGKLHGHIENPNTLFKKIFTS
jgi:hypothetical protein